MNGSFISGRRIVVNIAKYGWDNKIKGKKDKEKGVTAGNISDE